MRVLHDGQASDTSIQAPEHGQLEQQGQNCSKGIHLQVHVQQPHLRLQPLLIVLVLLPQLVHPRGQHLDLGRGLQLALHEGVEHGADEQRVGGHCEAEGLRHPEPRDGLVQALDQRGLEGHELRPQVVGQRIALGVQQHVPVLVPLQTRVEEKTGHRFPELVAILCRIHGSSGLGRAQQGRQLREGLRDSVRGGLHGRRGGVRVVDHHLGHCADVTLLHGPPRNAAGPHQTLQRLDVARTTCLCATPGHCCRGGCNRGRPKKRPSMGQSFLLVCFLCGSSE
mmetsp:Transcript_6000/g.14109  ORF Transcript_6000/g.14109 Transcript_6000/m.14109 type:complete len:281 (-) Transcript_6000:259-1101(-)